MKRLTNLFTAILLFVAAPAMAQMSAGTNWAIDATHSNIGFTVTHLVISEVDGVFQEYEGTVSAPGDDFENAQVNFTIKVASIDTDDENRNGHLQGADFFDAASYPEITFTSTSFKKVEGNKYALVGDLTMHGVTKSVTLDVRYGGTVKDPYGNTKAGFKISGEIDRFDFGLKWDAATEAGNLVVGREVELDINAQLVQTK